jgi:hypothetical protein
LETNENVVSQDFVVFSSPGTLFSENTQRPIDSWDVNTAMKMATEIVERCGATPYGFRFITKSRGPEDLDSKQIASSNMYYLGGRVMTVDEVEAEMPDEKILIANMRSNKWDRIIINTNSYRTTQPLLDGDVVLDFRMPVEE